MWCTYKLMTVMDLPTLFAPATPTEKLYLVIVVTDTQVQSALWSLAVDGGQIAHKSGQIKYPSSAELVQKVDESLQELGKESEDVNEVIFGLPATWVDGSGIASIKKPILKKITDDLTLKAVGFVVITEAVIQESLRSEPQLSALFVHLSRESLGVTLIKHGKITQTERVGVSGETAADLTESLARLTPNESAGQGFPAKILLYSDELTEAELLTHEQQIINHDWTSSQLFLHPPVIDRLPQDMLVEAIVRQGGKAVAAVQGLTLATPPTQLVTDKKVTDEEFGFNEVPFGGEVQPPTDTVPTADDENVTAVNAKSFGIPVAAPPFAVPPAMIDPEAERAVPIDKSHSPAAELPHATTPAQPPSGKLSFLSSLRVPNFKSLIKSAGKGEQKIAHHPFIVAGFILGLVTLFLGGFLYLKFTSTAVIALQLKTVPVGKDVTITLDPQATAVNTDALILPATLETKNLQGSASQATTGVKLVGEKAKGKVTLFNKTTSPKTFTAGTALSSGKYQFTLDEDVTVASASVSSSGSSETKTYGKAESNVTATVIGAESNLAKDTELKIAAFDSGTYSAGVVEALTGGSSREVRVVAEADRQTLLATVKADLIKQATEQLKTESGNGMYKIPTGAVNVTTASYDHKVGDEVDQLSLTLDAGVQAVSYQISNMTPLAQAILSSEIPPGYELTTEPPTILSNPIEAASASAQVKLQANLSSVARPQVNVDAWKNEIAGLSMSDASSKLQSRPEVSGVQIALSPVLAQKIIKSLPGANKIQIEFK